MTDLGNSMDVPFEADDSGGTLHGPLVAEASAAARKAAS